MLFQCIFLRKSEKDRINTGFQKLFTFIKKSGAEYLIPLTKSTEKPIYLTKQQADKADYQNFNGHNLSSVHIMGGVTSGENKGCVVDSYGQFHKHKNLFVNDSSLINTKLLKNPQGTDLTIALRNIDYFLKNYN